MVFQCRTIILDHFKLPFIITNRQWGFGFWFIQKWLVSLSLTLLNGQSCQSFTYFKNGQLDQLTLSKKTQLVIPCPLSNNTLTLRTENQVSLRIKQAKINRVIFRNQGELRFTLQLLLFQMAFRKRFFYELRSLCTYTKLFGNKFNCYKSLQGNTTQEVCACVHSYLHGCLHIIEIYLCVHT